MIFGVRREAEGRSEKAKVKPARVPDRLGGVLAELNGFWS